MFAAGDSWTYRYVQDGAEQRDYTETVQSIKDNTAQISVVDSRKRRTITTYDVLTNRNLIRYETPDGQERGRALSDASDNSAPIKFPFSLGSEWPVKYHFKVAGDPITQVFDAKVVGKENIRTPAGEFDAYRIEFHGFWQNDEAIAFGGKGRQTETYWYSPAVKRIVRREIKSYGVTTAKMSSVVIYGRVDELVGFTPAPAVR